ncbi:FAD-binding oxidoreductase [Thermomonospora umbrina]|uniref:Glycolate oxidase FAD binding subunit n=1 Tax=Thermomonospora umbrina TaxID=111806 RepID=A0A3D9STJ0_9ACTN|nr:FAD-binding oxidoreductase [Thermomonospora umbrina]REE99276.1 glycolate oxidase FAD binding subunit [Thermomonospora umbrina]
MSDALSALGEACENVREALPEEGVLGVAPSFVAAPRTVAEAAGVLRAAADLGLAVVPRGNETRLDWGGPPTRCDLLLDTGGLDRVIEHAAGDLVVKVEAGLSMERLAEVLGRHGQRLALDVPLPGSTVGGTLAAGAGGPSRLLYGSARDLLIGVTMVRADGAIAKAGGKVVKNVAGYDLGKLLTGSFGTLGVIVEAAFRLHPLPEARVHVTRACDDVEEAHAAVQRVLHSLHVPAAIEIDGGDGRWTVGVLLEGVPQGTAARAEAVATLLGPSAEVADAPPPWWGAYPSGNTLIEVTAPPTALPRLAATARNGVVRGSAGLGSWHVGFDAAEPAPVADLLAALRREVPGTAVVRYAPEAVRQEIDLWGPVPALALMRRLKDQFDPGHRLSPGRFVGGI